MAIRNVSLNYYRSAWVGYGAYFAKNPTVQWRLPLAISCLAPLLVLSGIYWLPESPRYLSLVGRNDEALQIIKRIHHDPNDPTDAAAHAEYIQIIKQIEMDNGQDVGYVAMFRKPSWRKRSLIAIFLMFATQSTGALGITGFQVVIYEALGLTKSMPLLMYGVYVTVAAFFNYFGAWSVDKVGRRRMFCKPRQILSSSHIVHVLAQFLTLFIQ